MNLKYGGIFLNFGQIMAIGKKKLNHLILALPIF
jgi:hypothetical protein